MTQASSSLIEIRGVSKQYTVKEAPLQVLREINLSIRNGEFFWRGDGYAAHLVD